MEMGSIHSLVISNHLLTDLCYHINWIMCMVRSTISFSESIHKRKCIENKILFIISFRDSEQPLHRDWFLQRQQLIELKNLILYGSNSFNPPTAASFYKITILLDLDSASNPNPTHPTDNSRNYLWSLCLRWMHVQLVIVTWSSMWIQPFQCLMLSPLWEAW